MSGRLAENITFFARALREAGLPIGPGAVLDAVEAVEAAQIGTKQDFFWTLHAVFVKKHEHSAVFAQAFGLFWKRRALIEKIIATLSPHSPGAPPDDKKPDAGALRAAPRTSSRPIQPATRSPNCSGPRTSPGRAIPGTWTSWRRCCARPMRPSAGGAPRACSLCAPRRPRHSPR